VINSHRWFIHHDMHIPIGLNRINGTFRRLANAFANDDGFATLKVTGGEDTHAFFPGGSNTDRWGV
jgi:hypothetical protein